MTCLTYVQYPGGLSRKEYLLKENEESEFFCIQPKNINLSQSS